MATLTRYRPFQAPRLFRRDLDELFGDLMKWEGEEADAPRAMWAPSMDVAETDTEFVVRTDLPGVPKKDISIAIDDHNLVVSGERIEERKVKEENYLRLERSTGQFYRSVRLPKDVIEDRISAEYADGVLTVHVPKAEVKKPRKITVS